MTISSMSNTKTILVGVSSFTSIPTTTTTGYTVDERPSPSTALDDSQLPTGIAPFILAIIAVAILLIMSVAGTLLWQRIRRI